MQADGAEARARIKGRIAACALFAACAASASAFAGSADTLPAAGGDVAALEAGIREKAALGDLVALAYRSNPMIRAAQAEWRGAVEKYRVDTAWPDPEVMGEGMYAADTLGDTAKPMDWTLALSQTIPLWGRQAQRRGPEQRRGEDLPAQAGCRTAGRCAADPPIGRRTSVSGCRGEDSAGTAGVAREADGGGRRSLHRGSRESLRCDESARAVGPARLRCGAPCGVGSARRGRGSMRCSIAHRRRRSD